MTRTQLNVCFFLGFLSIISFVPADRAIGCEKDFTPMFNGKDLSGWVAEGAVTFRDGNEKKPNWTVQDGMIHCEGHGYGFLRYDDMLKDFIVRLEFRLTKGCNSGLGIRGTKYTGGSTRPSAYGYEMQILDDGGKDPHKHSGGSLYRHVAPKVSAMRPAGEWNKIEVDCRGPKIKITLNGKVIQDLDQSTVRSLEKKPLEGYFSVQLHGRVVDYRNLRVKKL